MKKAHASHGNSRYLPKGLAILHEDRDILVVDKPAGLLTIATDTEKVRTAYFALTDYVRKGFDRSPNRVFIVHRLDRDTSGVLVFARTIEAKLALQGNWEEAEKRYLAVVHGTLARREGTIESYLAENSAHHVYETSDASLGKFSRTAYRVLREAGGLTLLEVNLLTGRKHQIRVHLASLGHPVVGDTQYGGHKRACERLGLHARFLSFPHPFSGERLTFEAPVPAFFSRLMGMPNRAEAAKRP